MEETVASRKRGKQPVAKAVAVKAEPEKKKGVSCLACNRKPSATEWAEYSEGKRAGKDKVAVGEQCQRCHEIWEMCYMYMPFSRFAALVSSEELLWVLLGLGLGQCEAHHPQPPTQHQQLLSRLILLRFE